MIFTTPTKHAAGVTLWGDFYDLSNLRETIHNLVEGTLFKEEMKDLILGLAYDVRHAYQRDREEKVFGIDEYDKVIYRGEKILWPVILFQVNALRYFAAFQPTTKEQQANLYRLEGCLEKSLTEQDAKIGAQCIEWLNSPSPITDNYYPQYLSEASKKYLLGPSGKARFRRLPEILKSFHPMSSEYKDFESYVEGVAKQKVCSPHELHDFSKWPDFKW
jgi:hypothetical protein